MSVSGSVRATFEEVALKSCFEGSRPGTRAHRSKVTCCCIQQLLFVGLPVTVLDQYIVTACIANLTSHPFSGCMEVNFNWLETSCDHAVNWLNTESFFINASED